MVIIYIGYYTICILTAVLIDLFGMRIATAVGTVQGRTNPRLIIVDIWDLSCTILHNKDNQPVRILSNLSSGLVFVDLWFRLTWLEDTWPHCLMRAC